MNSTLNGSKTGTVIPSAGAGKGNKIFLSSNLIWYQATPFLRRRPGERLMASSDGLPPRPTPALDGLRRVARVSALLALTVAVSPLLPAAAPPLAAKEPEAPTAAANREASRHLPPEDGVDFADAERGFVAALPDTAEKGSPAARLSEALASYAFLSRPEAPASVNPALWRQARANLKNGLFRVTDRLYQVRGIDIANMTIIEGDTGLIVIDPLVTVEAAKAGLDLYYANRPARPVVAVIYTHSHADHYGGVKGVVSDADVAQGKVQVIAPKGFLDAVVKENVIAGPAMARRAQYQFGTPLPRSETGTLDAGLGKVTAPGHSSLIPPTETIEQPIETRRIDGIEIVFMNTPDTEAPSEMIMYYPQFRALNMAELVTHTLHNLLPLRGTVVRNANEWSKDIGFALAEWGARTDILLAQHHWPTWGQQRVDRVLRTQRDLYKFINDQTLRLANLGYTPTEIAEVLKPPASLNAEWSARPLYGTFSHDAKAVYQRVLGWYDGNPATLNPLPPEQTGRKVVEYAGGAEALLSRARQDYAKGEYRWVAQITSNLVFAEPQNRAARELAADAFEQLGFQAESSTWRNAYLLAAQELRDGKPAALGRLPVNPDLVRAMPLDAFFDFLGVRLNAERAEGKTIVLNWHFTDTGQDYQVTVENSALTYLAGRTAPQPDAGLSLSRETLNALALKEIGLAEAVVSGRVKLRGNPLKLYAFFDLLDTFSGEFPVVTPKTAAR